MDEIIEEKPIRLAVEGWYPFSEIGGYLKTYKGLSISVAPPLDDRFRTFCHFAKATIPMDSARIIYGQVNSQIKELICSAGCGLKCFPN